MDFESALPFLCLQVNHRGKLGRVPLSHGLQPLLLGGERGGAGPGPDCTVPGRERPGEEQGSGESRREQLDATREAGAQSLRHASKSLYENYYSRSEELKKKHEDDKLLMQASKLEQEQKLKQNLENVNCVTERLEEKYSQITDMEKLVQRMEEEKKTLIEKKQSFEEKLLSNSEDTKSCRDLQVEIFTVQEQISHLQHVIQTQHQSLRRVIEEIEELNIGLQNQDKKIKTMKEKINMLEAQNKELKYKVEFWSAQPKIKVSKGVSTTSSRIDGVSPYSLLARLRKQNG
ncbi:coiled-coil domain-containing protein 68 isoform X3 [Caretta caretta]|uniref:coiled-coil domain-containing protein 68 isoform X3 n=1 Tax=Caretta caretta TaxID=8467 RepID=UPI002094223C|nr:coiled-coil domain-containing protein 68 isoform X3 [Caretta caretta]